MTRRGPRPIGLHLMLSAMRWSGLPIASMLSSGAWPALKSLASGPTPLPSLLDRLAQPLANASGNPPDPFAFTAEVAAGLARADREMIAGIAQYRRHPAVRSLSTPPAIWSEGGSRLLDYSAGSQPNGRHPGPVVLVVPSLVNRAEVLDLDEGASLMRGLSTLGLRPLLLDWGWPGELERGFTLTDYVAGRLERALVAGAAWAGQGRGQRAGSAASVLLAGYCMGGLLAVAVAQRRPELVGGLALLATPWDFHATEGEPGSAERPRLVQALLPVLEPFLAQGALPVDLLQSLFSTIEPFGIAAKYRAFSRIDPASARARRFVLLEDWLNDGVPLAAPVAREALSGWYGRNDPAHGRWRIAGESVDPGRIAAPCFVAVPSRDRIVPPASAIALAERLPLASLHRARAGHVGMVAGERAREELWSPLASWALGL